MTRPLTPTPEEAVTHGQANFGVFDAPFRNLNLADCKTGMPRLGGLRRSRLKEWQHFAIVHPDIYISIALVDAKIVCTSWLFVHDRRSGKSFEHVRKMRPGKLGFADTLWDAKTRFAAPGYEISLHNCLDHGQHRLTIKIEGDGVRPPVSGELLLHEDLEAVQPLVVMLPAGPNRPLYSHKAPLPVEGSLNIGDEKFSYVPGRDLALIDVHKAYYPRKTFWRWATFAACGKDGKILGANLTHNIVEKDDELNENAIWYGNSLSRLGPARFEVPDDPLEKWTIRTTDGRTELTLVPEGLRTEDFNMLIARSYYTQPFGKYSGFLTDDSGTRHEISDAFGVAEDHRVTW